MNKKAQGLPLTYVIVAILVILVLVIVVIFFLGGMRGVTEKIGGIFSKTVTGIDITLAVQSCQTYCEQAKLLPKDLRKNSAYCTITFNIDTNNDGEAQLEDPNDPTKGYKKYPCYDPPIDVECFRCGTETGVVDSEISEEEAKRDQAKFYEEHPDIPPLEYA